MLLLMLGVMLALFAIGVPVAFAMVLTALVALLQLGNVPLLVLPQRMFTGADSFPLMAIPLFILAGNLMIAGGVTERLSHFAMALVGYMRGGLAQVNIVNSMIMGGMTGSATADAVSDCKILAPMMIKAGYGRAFAAAVTGASATIAPIIPPSIPFIIYGSIAQVSIGQLFLAGAAPGVLMGLYMMVVVALLARRRNYPRSARPSLQSAARAIWYAGLALMLPLIIIGGILSGVFTPTEAGAVAVLYALLISLGVYRVLRLRDLPGILLDSGKQTGVVMLIIAAAAPFSWLLAREQVGLAVVNAVTVLGNNPVLVLLLLNLALLALGCFLDATALLIILVPVLVPLFAALHVDPVHAGVVVVLNLMIGLITPPFGLVMFVVCALLNVRISEFTREVWPFLVALVATLLTVTYVPDVALFLPRLAAGR
jgi:tripartite ATP-independent transporter DctM subunit